MTAKNLNKPGACANPTAVKTFLKETLVCLSGNNLTPITKIKIAHINQVTIAVNTDIAIAVLIIVSSISCVYFNTFYNAEKYFRQAEKARKGHEKLYAGWELEDDISDQFQRPRPQKAEQLYDKAARKASKVLEKYKKNK